MKIPSSFNEMTVQQFMDWDRIIKQKYEDNTERDLELLAALLGDDYKNVPKAMLKPYFKQMAKIFTSSPSEKPKRIILIGRKAYVAIVNPKDLTELMSFNQYTAFKQLTSNDPIQNMNRILALLYTPYKFFGKRQISERQEWLSKEFLKAKVGDVYGFVFFLGIQYNELMKASQPYLKESVEMLEEHMKEVNRVLGSDSNKVTDGIMS